MNRATWRRVIEILAVAASPLAAQQANPDLRPPVDLDPLPNVAREAPAATTAQPSRPVLMVPGLAPRPRAPQPTARPTRGTSDSDPVLVSPLTDHVGPTAPMPIPDGGSSRPGTSPTAPPASTANATPGVAPGQPIPLEIVPPLDDPPGVSDDPAGAIRPGPVIDVKPDDDDPREDNLGEPRRSAAPERPRGGLGGFVGRIFGRETPPAGPAPRVELEPPSQNDKQPPVDPAVKMKLQVTRQVRASLGDRVRDVEVFVGERRVHVRARATRFWQKRVVRRDLEAAAHVPGFFTTVELE